jgi:hypothetical protein
MRTATVVAALVAAQVAIVFAKATGLMLLNGWAHSYEDTIPAWGWHFWVITVVAHTVLAAGASIEFKFDS